MGSLSADFQRDVMTGASYVMTGASYVMTGASYVMSRKIITNTRNLTVL